MLDYSDSQTPECPEHKCHKEKCSGLSYFSIPAVLGDDGPTSVVAPKNGNYCNAVVKYEANGAVYLYSKEGVPVRVEGDAQIADFDFDSLSNRPKYAGQTMTSSTDIPQIPEDLDAIIPSQASAGNQLADKDFVNSSVATNTAYFVGTFNTIEELEAVQSPTNNDYGFVVSTDVSGNTVYNRYKFNSETNAWAFEYALNNSSFTAEQWAAIQSGITSGEVEKLASLANIKSIGDGLMLDPATGELSGGSAVEVVQTTGTSTTAVMSQKAVTDIVKGENIALGDSSSAIGANSVAVGRGATVTGAASAGVAIGNNARSQGVGQISIGAASGSGSSAHALSFGVSAKAQGVGSVAFGAYSKSVAQGEVNIGTTNTSVGYNNSEYRLFSGLYDGQGDHDAVNLGQLNSAKGMARELTEADYNYPASSPDGIALWLLEPGIYVNNSGADLSFYFTRAKSNLPNGQSIMVSRNNTYTSSIRLNGTGAMDIGYNITAISNDGDSSPTSMFSVKMLTSYLITDNLTTNSANYILSAKQGKVLNDKIGGDLANLATTDKSSLINAINELAQSGGGGVTAVGLDALIDGTGDITVDLNADNNGLLIGTHAKIVEITGVPAAAMQGDFTEEQLSALLESNRSIILFNNELYTLNDNGREAGTRGYSHIGVENNRFMLKNITVTLSTLSWVLTVQEVVDSSRAAISGGTVAPTTATVGTVGQLYSYVTDGAGHLAICTAADDETPTYTWSTLI